MTKKVLLYASTHGTVFLHKMAKKKTVVNAPTPGIRFILLASRIRQTHSPQDIDEARQLVRTYTKTYGHQKAVELFNLNGLEGKLKKVIGI